jgi:hypothetical protein
MSFLFIESVSSSIDSGAASRTARFNPEHGLLQFCQSDLASSITSVIFCTRNGEARCISATYEIIVFIHPVRNSAQAQPRIWRPHQRFTDQKGLHPFSDG